MRWYMVRTAKEDFGHGDTLDGQLMKKELTRIGNELLDLKAMASSGGPDNVLPRWRQEIRTNILKLPASERLVMMSMYELEQVSADLKAIRSAMHKYDAGRLKAIMGAQ